MKMIPRQVQQAARNNALWCDTVCRSHGVPGELHEFAWLNRHPVPRYYPNLITLSSQDQVSAQLARIQELIAGGLPGPWAVKDSFCELDLGARSFELLFNATWIWRSPSKPMPQAHPIPWIRLLDETMLAKWEAAWNGGTINAPGQPPRLFLPRLLADPDIAFIAAVRGGQIVAGAIANRSDQVVGLSNVFAPEGDPLTYWVGCVAAAMDSFPRLPLVGYERGAELALAQAAGFKQLSPLRVWIYRG
jgi:hypothetical protein